MNKTTTAFITTSTTPSTTTTARAWKAAAATTISTTPSFKNFFQYRGPSNYDNVVNGMNHLSIYKYIDKP